MPSDVPDGVPPEVAAVLDAVLPVADGPPLSVAGLAPYLTRLAADPGGDAAVARIRAVVDDVDARCRARSGRPAVEVGPEAVRDAVASLEPAARDVLVLAAARARWGDRDGPGARSVGWSPDGTRDPGAPVRRQRAPIASLADLGDAPVVDVLVLGAGAGGAVAALVAAEAGARVLVVDRGPALDPDRPRDHLRNHRSSVHGHDTGPPGGPGPRVVEAADGVATVVGATHDPAWQAGGMAVGGGTAVYQGMAWRFLPDDLAMASRYGVPDGSSLADWPLTPAELAPHWDWVEWEVGVCGDGTAHPAAGPRRRGYPMPPLPPNTEAAVLGAGAAALGLRTGPVPLLLNSVPRHGRARCVRCGECVGFACPVDARNGVDVAVLPRAAATGGATVVAGVRATRLPVDASGRVTGAVLVDEATGATVEVRAGHVVVACGAIETARLLLASRSPAHPDGLGNATDQVGRHLQGHGFASAFGRFDDEVLDPDGPGVSVATLDLAHGLVDDDGGALVGGGVVANELVKLPIVHWQWALAPDDPRWGPGADAAMRHAYRRTAHLFAQVQEVPRADNRVTLDPDVVDRHGVPVARLAGRAHPETVRTARHVAAVAERWLTASGARRTWADPVPTGLLAGYHQAGTCRMGTDPVTSVVDPEGRVHGHDNLWVADASVHVTNGSVNPALTIMALAHRTAGHVVRR